MQINVDVDATFLQIKITQVHYSRASIKLAFAGSPEFGFGVIVKYVASKWLPHCVFVEMNLSFCKPKKHQCDICCAHEKKNISEETYEVHILKKDLATAEKAMDKETALVECKTVVLTIDLQAVLLTHAILASAVYYKTKLCCNNFTVRDMTSKNICYSFWHESEGGLQSTSLASCLVDYIENEFNSNDVNTIIMFSDG